MTQTQNNDIVVEQCWYDKASAYRECPTGWQHIAKQVEAVLLAEEVSVRQIKEKFGGLRVYYDVPECWIEDLSDEGYGDKINQIETLINIADYLCQQTCMTCGDAGTQGTAYGWVSVFCDKHWKERKGE